MLSKAQIKDFAKVGAGQGAPQRENDFSSEGFPFIRAGSIEELLNGGNENDLPKVNSEIAKEYKLKLYQPDTIVFAKSGMSAMKGRIYKLKNPCYVVNHLATLELNENAFPDYVVYTLRKFSPVRLINDISYPSLKQSKIENYEIPFPSLQEQIQIANILNKAEDLIAQRRKSIDLLDEFLRGTFLELFGDPINNEKGFEKNSLPDFYINPKEGTKCGPFGSGLKKNEFTETGIAVWTMDNILKSGEFSEQGCLYISENKFQELKNYNAQNGDIIISRAGTVGKMCIIKTKETKSIISSNLIRLRLGKNLLPIYFLSLMKYCQSRVIRLKHGGEDAYTHMSTGILDKIIFPYPPLSLQNEFANIVKETQTIKEKYKSSLKELENLYGSLSQQAFKS
jgi:type I restriction enzyme S subunit